MTLSPSSKLLTFVRHAPSQPSGFLYGRYDADIGDILPNEILFLRTQISENSLIVCSPAKRCQKTCDAILSECHPRRAHDNLWEQSFGAWEGKAFSQIPDKGTLTGKALVNFKPPGGESFKELCERVHPVIKQFCVSSKTQKITFFVHAGVIRAALALAFGSHISALKCEIDTLSATSIRHLGTNNFSVVSINKSAIT